MQCFECKGYRHEGPCTDPLAGFKAAVDTARERLKQLLASSDYAGIHNREVQLAQAQLDSAEALYDEADGWFQQGPDRA